MNCNNSTDFYLKIIQKIQSDLREIDGLSSTVDIRDRVHELLTFIEDETTNNRQVFEEILFSKVKETNGVNSQLNSHLYILYRNLTQNKISMKEAKKLYKVYLTEFEAS